MTKVELVYDSDCPNVERARAQIRRAFAEVGRTPEWTEWVSDDAATPTHARGHGSPTILVNDQDVSADNGGSKSCRLYQQEDGTLSGVPPASAIVVALELASPELPRNNNAGTCARREDLVASRASWVLWGVPFGLIALGIVLPEARVWFWTPAFFVAGAACVANARRCGRTHCYITGPLYLTASLLSLLEGVGSLSIGWTWIFVGAVAGTALGYLLEWFRGRYVESIATK